jgi:uncharacterized protein YcfJ
MSKHGKTVSYTNTRSQKEKSLIPQTMILTHVLLLSSLAIVRRSLHPKSANLRALSSYTWYNNKSSNASPGSLLRALRTLSPNILRKASSVGAKTVKEPEPFKTSSRSVRLSAQHKKSKSSAPQAIVLILSHLLVGAGVGALVGALVGAGVGAGVGARVLLPKAHVIADAATRQDKVNRKFMVDVSHTNYVEVQDKVEEKCVFVSEDELWESKMSDYWVKKITLIESVNRFNHQHYRNH